VHTYAAWHQSVAAQARATESHLPGPPKHKLDTRSDTGVGTS